MKNKFSVFAAILVSCFMGISICLGDKIGIAVNLVLIHVNLWAAGFFEDSK